MQVKDYEVFDYYWILQGTPPTINNTVKAFVFIKT